MPSAASGIEARPATRPTVAKRGLQISRRTLRILSVVGFLALWILFTEINARVGWLNAALFPPPWEVATAGWELRRFLALDIGISVARSMAGFGIAAVLGVLLGLLVGYFRLAEDLLETLVELFRPIPTLAFLPIFIIWFGLGETSKVLLIAYACFFPIFVNTQQGVRYADPLLVRAALSLGASQRQVFTNVILRAALPEIITGLRLAVALSLIVLVAAELVAADSGMGFRIQESRLQFRVDRMLYGAVQMGVVGYIFNLVFRAAENHILRWKSRVEHSRG
jgi:ABC-type nitrate/sulfonate/bicarbonate transport system permease component